MGAWGFGLFESDHDFEKVIELSKETGLKKLEAQARKLTGQPSEQETLNTIGIAGCGEHTYMFRNRFAINNESKPILHQIDEEIAKGYVYYSIFACVCSDGRPARQHLDSGVLADMMAQYESKMPKEGKFEGYHEDAYKFILLGAGAMSLGCHLPQGFKALMIKNYWNVGLMRDALKQMAKALNGPHGYKDGEPYDFGSRHLDEVFVVGGAPRADRINKYGTLINVPEPHTWSPLSDCAVIDLRNRMKEALHGEDECGCCGAKEGPEGTKLRACGKCNKRKYCSKECQKKHWPVHKLVCAAPKGTKEEELRKELAVQMNKLRADPTNMNPRNQFDELAEMGSDWDGMRKIFNDYRKEMGKEKDTGGSEEKDKNKKKT